MKNVVILTSGLTGSSVLTGLIARAGYWTGETTYQKRDYDTFENARLIELNRQLFQEAGYRGNYLLEFSGEALRNIACLKPRIDCSPYREFVRECETHRPWIWKDPRLWLTIRFWKDFLDLDTCRFIILTRGSLQSWISSILRKQITTYRYSRRYEAGIKQSIVDFLAENRLGYLHLEYERLIANPVASIEALNGYLDTALSLEDLKKVYHKTLYKSPKSSWANHVKAMLIYLKNYRERLDIAVER